MSDVRDSGSTDCDRFRRPRNRHRSSKWTSPRRLLEPGKRADLLDHRRCAAGSHVYASRTSARRATAVQLVVIDGRRGRERLRPRRWRACETLTVRRKPRMIDYGPGVPKLPEEPMPKRAMQWWTPCTGYPNFPPTRRQAAASAICTLWRGGDRRGGWMMKQLRRALARRRRLPLGGEADRLRRLARQVLAADPPSGQSGRGQCGRDDWGLCQD